ncbi:PAS domain S-box protein, partial [Methylobacter sp.]|uniref:PAS domain S-box protein n=1 Tax=Methylobacter sp. TaxID=2051955 RepID=UPI00120002CB
MSLNDQNNSIFTMPIETSVENQSGGSLDAALPALHDILHGLQTVIDQTGSYIFTKDTAGRYTYVNQKVQDLFGTSYQNIVGKDDSHFFDLEQINELTVNDRRVIDFGETIEREERNALKPSGEERIYWTAKKPIRNDQGQIIGLCGISTDITAHKRIEEELQTLKSRLEFLLNSTPAVIYSARAYGDYGVTFISENVTSQLGYQPNELTEDSSFWVSRIHPDDLTMVHEGMRHLLESGFHKFDCRFQHKDGSFRWMLGESVLIRNSSGQSHEFVGYWLDITAQKVAEENQRISAKYLKRILDNLFCYVGLLDPDGIIQEMNDAPLRQSGIKREDVLGQYFYDGPWWAYDETVRTRLLKAIEAANQGETIRYEEVVKMGEDIVPIDFQISPVHDESGKIVGLLPTAVDISARKKAEAISKHHKVVIDRARDGFWVADLEGNLLEANQAYADMSGYSIKELETMHISNLEAMEDPSDVQVHIDRVLAQGFDLFNTRHRRKDGTFIDVEVSVNYMAESQQFFAFFRDITERQKTQLEVSRLLSRQHAILDGANYSIIATDHDGLITDFNAAAERMLGYSADEMIGKQTPEIIHDKKEVVIHAEKLSKELGYLVKPGFEVFVAKAKLGTVEECEWTYICKDGKRISVLLSLTAIFDEEKRIVGFMGIASDITERKKAEEALHIAATTFETHEAIMITSADGAIIRVNRAFESITGYGEEEVIGKNPRILKSGRHEKTFYADLWQRLQTTGSWNGEMWDRHKSGNIYPKQLTITAVKTADGETTQYVAMFADISKRKKTEEEIYNLAFYDPLTGLPNRRLILDRLSVAVSASGRSKQYGALLFLDLDNFKTLNDTMGHEAGDKLLIEVTNRLKFCVRETDTVARFGGDEFLVLIENISTEANDASQNVARVAEKIRATLVTPYYIKDNTHYSSPSIGVRLFCGNEISVHELIKHSDIAMYQAKNAGRNKVRFFDPELQQSVETRAALESDLRRAITEQQLFLYYQIQLDHDLRQTGAEALIRWKHPDRGMVPPAKFISVAEESSLILDIGNWILDTACQQIAKWGNSEQTSNIVLAVNISAKQFMQIDFV